MKCPVCKKEPAIIDPSYGVTPGEICQKRQSQYTTSRVPDIVSLSRKERIDPQRDEYGYAMLQPFNADGSPNTDFVKANPQRVNDYFKPQELAKLDI